MEENQVPTPEATDITDDDKLWSLLSWITGIVAVIVLFMEDKKSRPFLKYNAVMALVVVVVLSVLVGVISAITCGIGAVTAIRERVPRDVENAENLHRASLPRRERSRRPRVIAGQP